MIQRLDGFTADGFGNVIEGDPQDGDVIRIDGRIEQRWSPPATPIPPPPSLLSKTAFQDYAVSQLGAGVTGMARFTAIMDATRDNTDGAVRFAFARYEAALTFEKTNTASLTAIMVSASVMTADERTAIIDNWPTG